MTKPRILVSHNPPFLPIIKALVNDFDLVALVPQFSTELKNLDIPSVPLRNFGNQNNDGVFKWAAEVVKDVNSVLHQCANGAHPAAVKWLDELGEAFYYPRLADFGVIVLALDNAKPNLVLLHNDVEPINRAVALWAKERKVPCLHVPHAIYQDVNRTAPGTDIHDIVTSSHLAVSGPFQKEWYEKVCKGVEIRETGLPQFDEWATRQPTPKGYAVQSLGLGDKPVICYGSTWGQNTNLFGVSNEWQMVYLAFLEAVKELNVEVVVKCHPRAGKDNWQWHVNQANEAGIKISVTPDHLEKCIDASDLLVAYGGSNIILDASFRPGIKLASTHGYEGDEAVHRLPLLDSEEMRAIIAHILDSAPIPTESLRAKYLGGGDGQAHRRITEWCKELVK